jgi:hypothetical protein
MICAASHCSIHHLNIDGIETDTSGPPVGFAGSEMKSKFAVP